MLACHSEYEEMERPVDFLLVGSLNNIKIATTKKHAP